jgi:hypothetical protein
LNSIGEKAMLAAVHFSIWTARKHDRGVSREVAVNHNAEEKLGRYNKRLLAKGTKLDDIQALATKIRNYFDQNTLPWSDDGLRILPANLFFDLTTKMRDFEQEFLMAVEDFIVEYPDYMDAARPLLGSLHREEDYPSVEKLREKFGIKLEILPIPSGEDFRVQLSEEQKTLISEKIDANVRESIAKSNRDLWFRMYEVISHFAARLSDPDGRLHASVFAKVSEMADLLPKLNITDDPDLNSLARQVKDQLCQFSVTTLRDNDGLRADTATKAVNLAQQMDAKLCELARNGAGAATFENSADLDALARPAKASIPQLQFGTPVLLPVSTPPPAQTADEMFSKMSAYMVQSPAA